MKKTDTALSSSQAAIEAALQDGLGLEALEPRLLLDAAAIATGGEAIDAMEISGMDMSVRGLFSADMHEGHTVPLALSPLSPYADGSDKSDIVPIYEVGGDDGAVLAALGKPDTVLVPETRDVALAYDRKSDILLVPELPGEALRFSDKDGLTPIAEVLDRDAFAEAASAAAPSALYVVDMSVSDADALLAALPDGAQVLQIERGEDGVAKLADALQGLDDVGEIHILSHGKPGEFTLGTATVDAASMAGDHAADLAVIRDALSAQGDILIYGCDFGADDAAMRALAAATGADIAASTNDTGAAAVGGDWVLEARTGRIQAATVSASAFTGLLADTDGDTLDDSVDIDDDNDGLLDTREFATIEALLGTEFSSVTTLPNGHTTAQATVNGVTVTVTVGTAVSTGSPATNFDMDLLGGGGTSLNIFGGSDNSTNSSEVPVTITFSSPVVNLSIEVGSESPIEFQNDFMADGAPVDPTSVSGDLTLNNGEVRGAGGSSQIGTIDWTGLGGGNGVSEISFMHGRNNGSLGFIFRQFDFQAAIDTDGDGQFDHQDIDSDNDGILDGLESEVADLPTGVDAFFAGEFSLSVDGTSDASLVSNNSVNIVRPTGATVAAVYVVSFNALGDGPLPSGVRVAGIDVTLDNTETSSVANGGTSSNNWGDVTDELGAYIDGLTGSNLSIEMEEIDPDASAGMALVVVWNDPNVTDGIVALQFASDRTSDGTTITIPTTPLNPADPAFSIRTGLAINWSTGSAAEVSRLLVNGTVVTETAGGDDDGLGGGLTALITVGGTEDTPAPSLVNTLVGRANDREVYDLESVVSPGDTSIDITTSSSHDFDFIGLVWVEATGVPLERVDLDSDNDGVSDRLDLDSDNDGIGDAIEGHATAGYVDNLGSGGTDDDGDGYLAQFDTDEADFGSAQAFLADTDGDGTPDYLDLDSDGDDISDTVESGLTLSGTDTDGNGIDDDPSIGASYTNPDGAHPDPLNTLTNVDSDATLPDFRSVQDTDGDGVSDLDDVDDDNDGILDVDEAGEPFVFDLSTIQVGGSFTEATGSTALWLSSSPVYLTGSPGDPRIRLGSFPITDYETGSNTSGEVFAINAGGATTQNEELEVITFTADDLAPNSDYELSFAHVIWGRSNTNANEKGIMWVDVNGARIATLEGDPTKNFGIWTHDTFIVTSDANGEIDVSIKVARGLGLAGHDYLLDAINLAPTPGVLTPRDTDGDGIVDHLDLDSDNDGISDLVESGSATLLDVNNDGTIDVTEDTIGTNGLATTFGAGTTPLDTDADGAANALDLDSDADGIADAIETRPTAAGNVITSNADSDGDGVIDHFDVSAAFGGTFTAPTDTDTDGTADYVSTDSDGDGISDAAESGDDGALTAGVSYADADGTVDPATLQNIDNDASDVDFRSVLDTDGDGVADLVDIDDDNDGILDTVEDRRPPGFQVAVWNTLTFEQPSITAGDETFVTDATALQTMVTGAGLTTAASTSPDGNHIAISGLDSADLSEAIANDDYIDLTFTAAMDTEIVNAFMSLYTDGANPDVAGMNGTWMISTDGGTTFSIFGDTDFDNSGLHSDAAASVNDASIPAAPVVRAGETATVRLYLHGSPEPSGNIDDIGLTFVGAPADTDGDGVLDSLDLDSDNDGISDLRESGSGGLDADNDGVLDEMSTPALAAFNDADGDGLLETIDNGSEVSPRHSDGDGIADHLDLDSDGDGIADAIEARPTAGYTSIAAAVDTDGDGIIDAFDTNTTFGGTALADPVDTDSASGLNNNPDGLADYIDTDSDGDGILDAQEGFPLTAGTDTNADGIRDDRGSYADPDGGADPSAEMDNFVGDRSEVAYRELNAPALVDLNDDATTASRDHAVETVLSNAIMVNPIAGNGGVFDTDSASVSQVLIEIDEASFLDASEEFFVIAGEDIVLDPEAAPGFATTNTAITVNGNDYTVQTTRVNAALPGFGGPLVSIRIVQLASQGDGQIPLADMNAILQGLTYRNDAGVDATTGDRIYTVRAIADQPAPSTDSNTASGTISITDPAPIVDLNDDNTTPGLDVAVAYTEGDGAVVIAPAGDAIDLSNNITQVAITLAGFVDAGDETITVNGVTLTPGTDSSDATTTVGGTAVTISLTGATLNIAATDGTSVLDQSALDTLIRAVVYTHVSDVVTSGDRTLSFVATDANGNVTATAAVATISVTAVNDDPVATGDAVTTPEEVPVAVTVRGNDSDPDGDPLTVTAVTQGVNGSVVIDPVSGDPVYTPNANFNGTDSFTYTAEDGQGGTDTATVTVTVDPVNDDPVAVNDSVTSPEDTPVTVTARVNDSDIDGDPLTVTAVTQGANGSVVIDPVSGNPVYTPNANFNGTDSFTYTVEDGQGGTDTATVTVTVDPVNDAPVADADGVGTDEDTPVRITVLGNDNDVDGDPLSVVSTTTPSNGSATIDAATGEIVYTPDTHFDGSDSFTYTVDDGAGGTDTATVTVTVNPVNDAPLATPDTATTTEETPIAVVVRGNDSDVDGDPLTVSAVTDGTSGTVSIDPVTGNPVYSPDADFNGTDSFTYTVDDGAGGTDTATVTVTVDPINDAPVVTLALPAQSGSDGATISPLDSSAGFNDVDGDALAYAATGLPTGLSIDPATGLISGTPDAGASQGGPASDGVYNVTVTVTDPDGESASQTVSFTFTNPAPMVDAPIGPQTADDGDAVTFTPAFSDADGDTLSYTASGLPAGLTVDPANGTITGTLSADASQTNGGLYMITVTADDGNGGRATDSFTLSVANPPPLAADDSATTPEDQSVEVVVRGNDSDPDGDALSIIAVTQGANGSVVIDPVSGNPVYTPNANFNGADSFTYTLSDGQGGTATATVSVGVDPVNDAPVAVDDAVATPEDTPVSVTVRGNDADVDGDPLTVTAVTQGANGSVVIDPATGNPVYTPDADFNGTDSFTYTVEDGQGGSDIATVTVTVDPVNDAPVATGDAVTTPEDTPVSVTVRGNDADVDGDPLTVTAVTQGGNGSVVIDPVTGDPVYTPNADFNGTDSFTYTVSDGAGGSDTATVTVTVDPVNDAPVALDDAVTTSEDASVSIPVRGNDGDIDADTLTVVSVTQGANGKVSIDPVSGDPVYTPNADFNGTDSFTYTVNDGAGGTATATVSVTVDPVNDAPEAQDDAATTLEDQRVEVAVRGNDSDVDGDPLTVSAITQGANGTVSINPVTGNPVYTPDADFNGTDSFTYTVEDGVGGTDTATVFLTVTPVNDVPVATADMASTPEDVPVTIAVRDNDSDVDGDPLTVAAVTQGANGSVSIDPVTGNPVYTPEANFHGTDSFTYTVEDGQGGSDTATVRVTVTPVNDAPVGEDDRVTTPEDTPVAISVRGNDGDVDGDSLTVTAVTQGLEGIVTIDPATGNPVYMPGADFNGTDSFTYTVDDGQGGTDTVTVLVDVTPINDAPVAADDRVFTLEDTAVIVPVRGNDIDVDGDPLIVARVTQGATGSVSIDPVTGNPVYTPEANFHGTDSFTYTVEDGQGGTATATVNVAVDPANDAPERTASSPSAQRGADGMPLAEVDASPFFTDRDGDPLRYSLAGAPDWMSIDPLSGIVSGTPDGDASQQGGGLYTVSVVATDPGGLSARVDLSYVVGNPAPVVSAAAPDTQWQDGDTVTVATAFADPDGDTLRYAGSGLPDGLSIDPATGTITGTLDNSASQGGPDGDGNYTITVTADDGQGGSVSDVVILAVTNPAPDAVDDTFQVNQGESLDVQVVRGSDTDPDGDTLSATPFTAQPGTGGGLFSLSADGTLSFDPGPDFDALAAGELATTSITYTVSDGEGGSDRATVTVSVRGTNDAPTASGPLAEVSGRDGEAIAPESVSDRFSDPDDETLVYGLIDAPSWIAIDPQTGVISGTAPHDASQGGPNGDGVYVVTVVATDPDGETAQLQRVYSFANTPVEAVADSFTVDEDGTLIGDIIAANDRDADGDVLTLDGLALPDGDALPIGAPVILPEGTLTVQADGSFTFVAAPDYNGVLTFGYTVTDGEGSTDAAAVTITVTPKSDAPELIDPEQDNQTGNPDGVLPRVETTDGGDVFAVPTADVFMDPDGEPLIFTLENAPDWMSIDPQTGVITGTPPKDASVGGTAGDGRYAVTVVATDPEGLSVSTVLQIEVANPAPVAVGDGPVRVLSGETVTLDLLANDSDPDGDVIRITEIDGQPVSTGAIVAVEGGTVTLNADGTVTFAPDAGFSGTPRFAYTLSDGQGGTDTAEVSMEVPAPPGDLVVTETPDGRIKVTGTGEPFSTIRVDFPDGTTAMIQADENGNWSVTSETAQPPGELRITQLDADGTPTGTLLQSFTPSRVEMPIFTDGPGWNSGWGSGRGDTVGREDGSGDETFLIRAVGADLTGGVSQHPGGPLSVDPFAITRAWNDARGWNDTVDATGERQRTFRGDATLIPVPGAPGDEHIWIEAIARGGEVDVQLASTTRGERSVRSWSVTQGNGAPLPAGAKMVGDYVVISRSLDTDTLSLRIRALLENGQTVTQSVSIDLDAATVDPVGEAVAANQTLHEQMAELIRQADRDDRPLLDAAQ